MSVVDLFLELIKVPSPSGLELDISQKIIKLLSGKDMSHSVDDSGSTNNSNTGNLIFTHKINDSLPTIMLVAHMDTVLLPSETVSPVLHDHKISTDGTTILGADNKASVAAIIAAVQETKLENTVNIKLVFTTREESGTFGSSLLTQELFADVDYVFNLDGAEAVGIVSNKAMGYAAFDIHFKGKSAHSGLAPETGINAISMAAEFINITPVGRINSDTTVNFGKFTGGTLRNAVPDSVELLAEIRSYSDMELDKIYREMQLTLQIVVDKYGRKFTIENYQRFPTLDSDVKSIESLLMPTYKKLGLDLKFMQLNAISDANNLAKYGKPVININRGGTDAHTKTESINISELERLTDLVKELLLAKNYN